MINYTYELLRRRVEKLERIIINESKQVGTLYHVCSPIAYLKYIVPKDELAASGRYRNSLYGSDKYVSFTRDKYFTVSTGDTQSADVIIRLVVDGDKLSERYKVRPYNDKVFDNDGTFLPENEVISAREMEECVKGPIKNISRYIKQVQFDVPSLNSKSIASLKDLLKRRRFDASKVVFGNFIINRGPSYFKKLVKDNLAVGDSIQKVISVLETGLDNNPRKTLFSRDIAKVQQAIDNGTDVNLEYDNGYPLSYYCFWNNYDIVKLLLDNGADVNADSKNPAICRAAANASPNIVNLLIKNGADVNAKDKDGNNTVIAATHNDDAISVLKLLIKAGADVNHVNKYGMTALKLANDDVYDFLVNEGAVE